jgi:hypothetical protein
MTEPTNFDRGVSKDTGSKDTGSNETAPKSESLKGSAAALARRQKEVGAEQLSGIAGAVHAAADELERQVPGAGGYVHDAAARIDTMASGLKERDLSQLADGMRQLGRERPLALFGGAVLVGFALSRFLKSGQEVGSGRQRT